jgi:spermidine/putrescine transport system ATP-binding protein
VEQDLGRNQGGVIVRAPLAAMAGEVGYVVLREVAKRFGGVEAVRDVSLDVRKDEFITILGPSGCGKTTVLRMIAGLEIPDKGTVLVDGRSPDRTRARARKTRMVFQHYALFPHLTVRENIAYGLRMRGDDSRSIAARVSRMLERMALTDKPNRKPRQLSGGEQQRVALARALVTEPTVLLLDEPLGALDRQLRSRMQLELKELQRQLAITFIYVTHDQEEALVMSDRIVVMNQGQIAQVGIAEEIYERPRTRFVAEFIGVANLLEGGVVSKEGRRVVIRRADHLVPGLDLADGLAVSQRAVAVVRPESISVNSEAPAGASLTGNVISRSFLGSVTRLVVKVEPSQQILCDCPGEAPYAPGDRVFLTWPQDKTVVLAA